MATHASSTPTPNGAVVAFPRPAPDNAKALRDQRWRDGDLPANACPIRRRRPEPYQIPPTPERALLRALVSQLTPKAYTGLLTRLARQREAGCPYSGIALLIATEQANGPD